MDRSVRILATLLTALAALGGAALRAGTPAATDPVELSDVPAAFGEWVSRDVPTSEETRRQLQSDALLLRAYTLPDEPPVWLFVDYHRTQRLGATIHSPRICYPGSGWNVRDAEVSTIEDDPARPACWLRLARNDERMLAVYWYESRWGLSARETTLKLQIMRSALARRTSDAVLVRASTPIDDGDEAAARDRLRRFLREAVPQVGGALPFEVKAS